MIATLAMIRIRRLPITVAERAGDRRGDRRGVGQESEEQSRRDVAAAEIRMWNGAVGSN